RTHRHLHSFPTRRSSDLSYRIVLTDTEVSLEHLGNQRSQGPAIARIRGRLMGSGETHITATVQPQTGSADIDLTAQIERVDLARSEEHTSELQSRGHLVC